jgi:hypothetical protein
VIGHGLPALLAPEGHGEIDWSHDYEPVKILDRAGRGKALLAHPNPPALFGLRT